MNTPAADACSVGFLSSMLSHKWANLPLCHLEVGQNTWQPRQRQGTLAGTSAALLSHHHAGLHHHWRLLIAVTAHVAWAEHVHLVAPARPRVKSNTRTFESRQHTHLSTAIGQPFPGKEIHLRYDDLKRFFASNRFFVMKGGRANVIYCLREIQSAIGKS